MPEAGLRRLHPFTLAFDLFRYLRSAVFPLAILTFVAPGGARASRLLALASAAAALSVAGAAARYLTFRFGLDGDRLVIREGLLFRRTRTIPASKIQNIDLKKGPVQRLLGVVEVRVETAGTGAPEAQLSLVGEAEAAALRDELLQRRGAAGPPAAAPVPELVRASTIEELLLAGATENRVGAIMAGILGIVELFDQLGAAVRGPFRQVLEPVFGRGALTAVVMVTLSAVALLAAGWLVSVLVTLVNFHGFTLRRLGGELRRRHGLLTQFEAALPIPRIQVLRLEANPLRRFMGYLGVRAETAGSAKDQEAGGATTLCPLLRRAEAGPFCRVVFPDLDLEGTALRPVHPLAFRRGFVRFLLLSLAGVAAAVPALGPRALWALAAAVPAAAVLARLRYRALGFASPGRFLLARAGVWPRRLWVVPREKVQSAALSQGPIQRWLRLATLSVDTAGAGPLRQARIIDLPVEEARALLDGLAA